MLARCEELIPLVDGGDVRSVHDDVFLHQAQPAAVGGRVEVGVGGQRLPRDVERAVAILKLPDNLVKEIFILPNIYLTNLYSTHTNFESPLNSLAVEALLEAKTKAKALVFNTVP